MFWKKLLIGTVVAGFVLNAGFLALNVAIFNANRSDHHELVAYAAKQNQTMVTDYNMIVAARQNYNLRFGTCMTDDDLPKGYACIDYRPERVAPMRIRSPVPPPIN